MHPDPPRSALPLPPPPPTPPPPTSPFDAATTPPLFPIHRGHKHLAHGDEPSVDPDSKTQALSLSAIVGQEAIKACLEVEVDAMREGSRFPHTLLYGSRGQGRTTIAFAVAHELSGTICVVSSGQLSHVGAVASVLTGLESGDVVVLQDPVGIPNDAAASLADAMRTASIDVTMGRGAGAQTIRVDLRAFVVVAIVKEICDVPDNLLGAFDLILGLIPYDDEEIARILSAAPLISLAISADALTEIARRSRGELRTARQLLRRIESFAISKGAATIGTHETISMLRILGVEEDGLNERDRRVLTAACEFGGADAMTLDMLAVLSREDPQLIEDEVEPFLIRSGYLTRTARGRRPTAKGHRRVNNEADPLS